MSFSTLSTNCGTEMIMETMPITTESGNWGHSSQEVTGTWGDDCGDLCGPTTSEPPPATYWATPEYDDSVSTLDYGVYETSEEEMPEGREMPLCEVCGEENPNPGRCCSEPCWHRWQKNNSSKKGSLLTAMGYLDVRQYPNWDTQKRV